MIGLLLQIFWVFFVFPRFRSMESLLISYPLSWLGVSIVNGLLLYYLLSKLPASRKA